MKKTLGATVGVAALGVAIVIGVLGMRARTLSLPPGEPARQPGNVVTLDPNLFHGQVKAAYQVARRDPALLAQLKCYCECERSFDHRSLLDCFRDTHGANCGICIDEALWADRAAREGASLREIQDALRVHYSRFEGKLATPGS
jgi:Protein of unknown function with PCYCGC motif